MYALAEQDKGAVYSYDVKTGKSISQQDVKGSPAHVGVNKDGLIAFKSCETNGYC